MAESRTALIDWRKKKSSLNRLSARDNQWKGNGNSSICRIRVPQNSKPDAYNWIPERIRRKKIVFQTLSNKFPSAQAYLFFYYSLINFKVSNFNSWFVLEYHQKYQKKPLTNPFRQTICQMIKSRTAIRDMTQKMLWWHSKDAFFLSKCNVQFKIPSLNNLSFLTCLFRFLH